MSVFTLGKCLQHKVLMQPSIQTWIYSPSFNTKYCKIIIIANREIVYVYFKQSDTSICFNSLTNLWEVTQPTCECKNQVCDWPVDWQAMPCQGLPTKCYVQQSNLNYHSFQGTKRHVSLLYLNHIFITIPW